MFLVKIGKDFARGKGAIEGRAEGVGGGLGVVSRPGRALGR
jgi:hypothetical protein